MKLTCGTDLVPLKQIERSLGNPRFLQRFFSSEERAFFAGRRRPLPSGAASFAAKEAFAKALGTGVRGFALAEVSVLRDALGRPYYALSGRAAQLAQGWEFSLSLSHTEEYAVAFAVAFAPDGAEEPAGRLAGLSIP